METPTQLTPAKSKFTSYYAWYILIVHGIVLLTILLWGFRDLYTAQKLPLQIVRSTTVGWFGLINIILSISAIVVIIKNRLSKFYYALPVSYIICSILIVVYFLVELIFGAFFSVGAADTQRIFTLPTLVTGTLILGVLRSIVVMVLAIKLLLKERR